MQLDIEPAEVLGSSETGLAEGRPQMGFDGFGLHPESFGNHGGAVALRRQPRDSGLAGGEIQGVGEGVLPGRGRTADEVGEPADEQRRAFDSHFAHGAGQGVASGFAADAHSAGRDLQGRRLQQRDRHSSLEFRQSEGRRRFEGELRGAGRREGHHHRAATRRLSGPTQEGSERPRQRLFRRGRAECDHPAVHGLGQTDRNALGVDPPQQSRE